MPDQMCGWHLQLLEQEILFRGSIIIQFLYQSNLWRYVKRIDLEFSPVKWKTRFLSHKIEVILEFITFVIFWFTLSLKNYGRSTVYFHLELNSHDTDKDTCVEIVITPCKMLRYRILLLKIQYAEMKIKKCRKWITRFRL